MYFALLQIPRDQNYHVDVLVNLASMLQADKWGTIEMESLPTQFWMRKHYQYTVLT